jgi:hypothetical protein
MMLSHNFWQRIPILPLCKLCLPTTMALPIFHPVGGDVCLRVVVVYAGLLGVWEGRGVREKCFSKFSKQYLFGYYYETILAKYL